MVQREGKMREIRFRAWDKFFKVMRYLTGFNVGRVKGTITIFWGDGNFNAVYDDAPLMQFTSLHDRNGKEIWEGDILSFDGNMTADNSLGSEPNGYIYDQDSKHEVIWNEELSAWDLKYDPNEELKYKRDTRSLMISECAGVIGNIYENPELLEGK